MPNPILLFFFPLSGLPSIAAFVDGVGNRAQGDCFAGRCRLSF
jgi:hypothetical protein